MPSHYREVIVFPNVSSTPSQGEVINQDLKKNHLFVKPEILTH